MGNYKRPAVIFNLDNPSHKELYKWCINQTSNFSDFVRTILFSYRQQSLQQSQTQSNFPFQNVQSMSNILSIPNIQNTSTPYFNPQSQFNQQNQASPYNMMKPNQTYSSDADAMSGML